MYQELIEIVKNKKGQVCGVILPTTFDKVLGRNVPYKCNALKSSFGIEDNLKESINKYLNKGIFKVLFPEPTVSSNLFINSLTASLFVISHKKYIYLVSGTNIFGDCYTPEEISREFNSDSEELTSIFQDNKFIIRGRINELTSTVFSLIQNAQNDSTLLLSLVDNDHILKNKLNMNMGLFLADSKLLDKKFIFLMHKFYETKENLYKSMYRANIDKAIKGNTAIYSVSPIYNGSSLITFKTSVQDIDYPGNELLCYVKLNVGDNFYQGVFSESEIFDFCKFNYGAIRTYLDFAQKQTDFSYELITFDQSLSDPILVLENEFLKSL